MSRSSDIKEISNPQEFKEFYLNDAYAVILKKFFNIPSLDYRLLGRWIASFRKGIFFHKSILHTELVTNEKLIGWMAHYAIGITFAILLLFIYGKNWMEDPTLFRLYL